MKLEIGNINWNNDDILNSISEFLDLYKNRPIKINEGGMRAPQMFACWFLLKTLKPSIVIESGVFKGQSTWLIENTLPNTKLFSLDVDLSKVEYKSEKAIYIEQDFLTIDWDSKITDKSDTLLFFDDHQDEIKRTFFSYEKGFKHIIFEDNYPAHKGDCYSIKKAFMKAGHKEVLYFYGRKDKYLKLIKRALGIIPSKSIKPNSRDKNELLKIIETYYEFPPVFKSEKTFWNEGWDNEQYPTKEPILSKKDIGDDNTYKIFQDEAIYYMWLCYIKLN